MDSAGSVSKDRREQLDPNVADLFPLPLSPFEKYAIWDEQEPHPMVCFIELHFETPLDLEILADALQTAVRRNPLLSSRVVERDGGLFWDYDCSLQSGIILESDERPLPDGWPRSFDLQREAGTRFYYGLRGAGSRLLVVFHHAVCDGIGMRRVVIDALTGYALQRMGNTGEPVGKTGGWKELNVKLLADRFDFSKTFSGPPSKRLSTWQRLKNARYFHFQLPRPILGKGAGEPLTQLSCTEPLRHLILDRELSGRILDAARLQSLGINELGLSILFQTCARWNRAHGDDNPKSRIRLLMPYDLRSRVDRRMPATNRLSFSFLGRSYADCEDLSALVASVRTEIKEIKETRLPLDFLNGLAAVSDWPRLMKWGLRASDNMATAVMTYAGDVSRGLKRYLPEQDDARVVGDARLTQVLIAPPVRRNTNIGLGLCINWGQLCISAAWNREVLSAEECDQFLANYAAGWKAWLDASECSRHV